MKGNIIGRVIVILALIGFSAWFLIPTARWYHVPEEKKQLLENEFKLLNPNRAAQETNLAVFYETEQDVLELKQLKAKVLKLGLDLQGGMRIVLQADLTDMVTQDEKDDAMHMALEILRNRIDQFGVSEPSISKQGEDRIVVQLPGVKDPSRVGDVVNVKGLLNFKLVDEELSQMENFVDMEKGLLKAEIELPENREIRFLWEKDDETGELVRRRALIIYKNASLTGSYLKTAKVGFSQYGDSQVDFELKPDGANIFGEVTGENVGNRLAIELDGKIRSAPTINGQLFDRGTITGSFTPEEARDLALILRAGALPVEMEIVEQRVVGPSLGADSIRQGVKATLLGFALVIIFMLIYYKASGIVANIAVLVNLFVTLGLLRGLNFTLTLPGIAGLILTIGMSVDACVIIFERIKEEASLGKTPAAAIQTGYERAYTTIIDANLTTLITAAVLFQFGIGPIKGFAVTMFIGISVNLITAIYLTKTVYMFVVQKTKLRRLSI